MINNITIQNVATYGASPTVLNDLRKINFIFGANGTGKTTIGRAIEQSQGHENCTVRWDGDVPLQAMIYNKDFVEQNFNQENTVRGVFTLGDDQVKAEKQIKAITPEIDKLVKELKSLHIQLKGEDGNAGKQQELDDLEESIKQKCWRQKQEYDDHFREAFTGVRNNSERFKNRVLAEKQSSTAELLTLDFLKSKAETVFAEQPELIDSIPEPSADALIQHESNAILRKPIVGNQDVDIAAMINKLGNNDWVKRGRHYHQENQDTCPFCQQPTSEQFAKSLNEFFSEAFEQDSQKVDELARQYQDGVARLTALLERTISVKPKHLELEIFTAEVRALNERLSRNLQLIETKQKEPSRVIEFQSINEQVGRLLEQVRAANKAIHAHNQTVQDLSSEKARLTTQIWRYVLEELNDDLDSYFSKKDKLSRAIKGMTSSIQDKEAKKNENELLVRELERQSTSILPTKDAINDLLASFGFTSFKIDVVDNKGHYKICRASGEDASRTLSEGEKTFITFLYFYSLIKGSNSSSGITNNRIVVFDDPVSSLDSDILYIVSSLIKGVFDEVRTGAGHVKQVFVLTHNVYFHKEISFHQKRPQDKILSDETFWMVRKLTTGSIVTGCSSNPIKSAYELLWDEVKNPNPSSLTLQNTLRRILENYFTMWGGKSKDEICAMFTGREKLICQSLFSWVNDGSHSIHDDLYINHGEQTNQTYLRVFKQIFEESHQLGHYQMMMGSVEIEEAKGDHMKKAPVKAV